MNVTKLQSEIANVSLDYVIPNNPCIEKTKNRNNECIDKIKCYFYNTGKSNTCSKIGNEAYCAITAWTFVHQAFRELNIDTTILNKIKTARAVDIKNKSRANGVVVDKNYQIGDIFYRKSSDPSASGHVGIVVGYDENFIYTVEGNNSFKYNGKKYEGIWEWKYPISDINTKGFEFIHIGKYIKTNTVNYIYKSKVTNKVINYDGGDGWGITNKQVILGVALFSSLTYYLINKLR